MGFVKSILPPQKKLGRVLNVHFRPVELKAGEREVVLECVEAGAVGLDSIWVKED